MNAHRTLQGKNCWLTLPHVPQVRNVFGARVRGETVEFGGLFPRLRNEPQMAQIDAEMKSWMERLWCN
jgi:hypothetical protein